MAKKWAIIFGIVFVIVGILGFFPNSIVGSNGFFLTDRTHNIIHLLVGLILLIVSAKGEGASALWLKVFGAVYIILFIDGLIQKEMLLGFVSANMNDAWLHLVLGVVLLLVGMTGGKNTMMMDKATM